MRTNQPPTDLVDLDFTAIARKSALGRLLPCVATCSEAVYVAFVIDVFSQWVMGWLAAASMSTELVLDCLETPCGALSQDGVSDPTGLIHHIGAGRPVHLVHVHQQTSSTQAWTPRWFRERRQTATPWPSHRSAPTAPN